MKIGLIHLLLLLMTCRSLNAQMDIDSNLIRAGECFEAVKQLTSTPRASLWGRDLSGPVLLVDPVTRRVYANQPDGEGMLQKAGKVFSGNLPVSVNIANTATTWAGVKWTMLLLPLPASPDERAKLMAHELYHRIQSELGLPGSSPVCDHLDSKEGRIYFRLELEAIGAALRLPPGQRKEHLQRALQFRQWRYALFPAARAAEEGLEMNEGLAEYTGVYVSGIAEKEAGYLPKLADSAIRLFPSLVRSFAYITGPLYGMLLTQRQEGWQRQLTARDNFPDLVIKYYSLSVPAPLAGNVMKSMNHYQARLIMREEMVRENARKAWEKKYLSKLVNGPVLRLNFTSHMSISFNPGNLFPLGDYGTVYPTMTVTDEWGRLVVTGDARMKDWRQLWVAMPAKMPMSSSIIRTADWQLELATGWAMVPDRRKGDYVLQKQP